MNDRELLELAAKAAGVQIVPCTCRNEDWPFKYAPNEQRRGHWNPLRNDGDALRLAVDLSLQVKPCETGVDVCDEAGDEVWCEFTEPNSCHYQMTRRAIVRAAAEIGMAMP
ncbi:hypothetical protein [Pseudomonas massiliensis]|uniref:hypothetical protein n=1 Tax=Pseudomonas massiliensis TaxID=522492 RepID=UPI00058F0CC8|nr:hypothetical protein [Pseudomonas massiliensis]